MPFLVDCTEVAERGVSQEKLPRCRYKRLNSCSLKLQTLTEWFVICSVESRISLTLSLALFKLNFKKRAKARIFERVAIIC